MTIIVKWREKSGKKYELGKYHTKRFTAKNAFYCMQLIKQFKEDQDLSRNTAAEIIDVKD